jgi:hypothetical protein
MAGRVIQPMRFGKYRKEESLLVEPHRLNYRLPGKKFLINF